MKRPKKIIKRLQSRLVLGPLVLVAALLLGGFWFFNKYEKRAFKTQQGMSPAARKNPLLAAERYLRAMGLSVQSRRGLEFFAALPSTQDAILVRHLPNGLSKALSDDLYQWVEKGGHLLVVPSWIAKKRRAGGHIFEKLGVRRQIPQADSDCGCPTESSPKKSAEPKKHSGVKKKKSKDTGYHPFDRIAHLDIGEHSIRLELAGAPLLEDLNDSAIYRIPGSYHKVYREASDEDREDHNQEFEENGAWLLDYRVKKGRVTVLSEVGLFNNTHIGDHDHAFFLTWLFEDVQGVWLIYESHMDSLLNIIWKHQPHFLISLMVLISLTIWKLQKNTGARLTPPGADYRNVLAHVDATGRFAWRTNRSAHLLAANRKGVLAQWTRRKLGHAGKYKNSTTDAHGLAALSDVSEEEYQAAFGLPVDSEQQLIKTSRALQKILTLIQGGDKKEDGH